MKLEAENNALREIIKAFNRCFETLKENRNELLDFLKRVDRENWLDGDWWEDIAPLIEKTEALKDKEDE